MLPFIIAGKRIKTTALFIILITLGILNVILAQVGQVAAEISIAPDWIAPTLSGIATILGVVLFVGITVLLITYGVKWLPAFLSDEASEKDKAAKVAIENAEEARSLTKDLARTVANLEKHGDKSGALVNEAKLQTVALIELIKTLSRNAYSMTQTAKSLQLALAAIESNNPLKITRTAGSTKDEHIRTLMLLPFEQGDERYWQNIARLIAVQLGTSERWETEYSQLAASLIAEVSVIKTRLVAVSAQIEVAQIARPLLQAKVNLDETTKYLRLPDESPRPDHLLAPQNEYTRMEA